MRHRAVSFAKAASLGLTLFALVFPSAAHAQFRQFCSIILLDDGELRQSFDLQSLSSKSVGGREARALIATSNSSFEISIHAPTGFSLAPPDATGSILFNASMYGRGATDFSEVPDDTTVRVHRGLTFLYADLVATALSGAFTAGNYRAETTIRCE